jgi:hypothetical protein
MLRIGMLALGLCAILNAQLGLFPKLPTPRKPQSPSCNNCVRDLSGLTPGNPAPVRTFRSTHPCPTTGSVKGACPGYVVMHAKALNRGGSDIPKNLRWRTIAQAAKDRAR